MKRILRLGKYQRDADNPRPLAVSLATLSIKYDILKETKKLKGKTDYKEIRIQHDLTRSQREGMRRMVDKARRMEAGDRLGKYIYWTRARRRS